MYTCESAHACAEFPALASLSSEYDHRRPFMAMTNTKTPAPAGCSLDAMIRGPSTTPAYYMGRPARVWIAAFRRGACAPKPWLESESVG